MGEEETIYNNPFDINHIVHVKEDKESLNEINLHTSLENAMDCSNDVYQPLTDYYASNNYHENNIKTEPCINDTNICTESFHSNSRDIESNEIMPKIKLSEDRKFHCMFCIKVFAKKQQLQNHIKTHTKEKNFICETCKKMFIHKQQLKNHEKIHTGIKDFRCSFCDKCFMLKQQLQIHVKIHTGEKNFMCTLCEKAFITKQQLQNHMNSHLGIKPFICNECHKQFAHKQQLDRHTKNHAVKQNYNCSECEAKLLSKTAYNVHLKEVHSDNFVGI